MPLGTRLRSAWLALFASPACAAVRQPHPPVAEGAWLRPRPRMLAHPSGSASPNLPSESFAFFGAFLGNRQIAVGGESIARHPAASGGFG